jgi:hypothetical protein
MKILRLAVVAASVAALQGAAADAGGAREKLAHVAPLAGVRPEAALKHLRATVDGLPRAAALGPELRAVPAVCSPAGAQPVFAEAVRVDGGAGVWRPVHAEAVWVDGGAGVWRPVCGLAGGVGATVAAWGPIAGFAEPVARTAPEYRAAAATAALDVDPFLTPYDVWTWSPLGDLRGEALEARERGETARFQRLQALYWERLETALERRRVLGGGRDGDGR